jgi:hypothetical protein
MNMQLRKSFQILPEPYQRMPSKDEEAKYHSVTLGNALGFSRF